MHIELSSQARPLNQYPLYWAECFGTAPFLPMSRAEMEQLGWDSCDIIIVTGDAYVDHPSFGMAIIGRLLEAQGYRVGIIAQPEWESAEAFKTLGKPNLFFGITAGNMDSMINRYTADRKIRSDDAYSPDDVGGKRPDRCSIVYSQRCREAFKDTPIIIGGIEASLRRIAHYDYWQDKVRRSILADARADLLLYGNAERALVEFAQRLARGDTLDSITDIRGTAFFIKDLPPDWTVIDSTNVDKPGRVENPHNPYLIDATPACDSRPENKQPPGVDIKLEGKLAKVQRKLAPRLKTVLRLPSLTMSVAIRYFTRMPTACCTSKPIPATRVHWCKTRAVRKSGLIRRQFRFPAKRWTTCSVLTLPVYRTRPMAARAFPHTK
jgi:hypothetical protein